MTEGCMSGWDPKSLMEARYQKVEAEIRAAAASPIIFDFDIQGTQIFSMMELAQGYARRSVQFIDALKSMLVADQIVAATVVARALLETVAMGCLYIHDMEATIEAKNFERFDARFERFY